MPSPHAQTTLRDKLAYALVQSGMAPTFKIAYMGVDAIMPLIADAENRDLLFKEMKLH